jgi:hypothetical protein
MRKIKGNHRLTGLKKQMQGSLDSAPLARDDGTKSHGQERHIQLGLVILRRSRRIFAFSFSLDVGKAARCDCF